MLLILMTLDDAEQNRVLALWRANGGALVRYARRELGPGAADEAEDVVSDAFERLMIHYERYGGRTDEQMKGLLMRMVKNRAADAHRRRRRIGEMPADPDGEAWEERVADPAQPTPEERVISGDRVERMKAVIRSLPPALRDTLEMRLLEDMTIGEIAGECGVSEEAVRQRLSRARRLVRIRWEEEEEHE